MNWKEYLYLDENRVNAYYDQIASGTIECVSNHPLSLWPQGVKVEPVQEIQPCYTVYEKAHVVEHYIRHSHQFSPKRHSPQSKGRDFVYFEETLLAQKVHVNEKLSLWVSDNTQEGTEANRNAHGHLLLVEGTKEPDGRVNFYGGWSTAAMLSKHENLQLEGINSQEFDRHPVRTFAGKGHWVQEPLKIRTLYRVRCTCKDLNNGNLISTLGYPMAIFTA